MSSFLHYETTEHLIEADGLSINNLEHSVTVNGEDIYLTKIEYDILFYLARNPGRVFTYQQIYEAVWNEPYNCEKGNIMTHIRHIREKIERVPSKPQYIENIRGVGYKFCKK